MAEDYRDCLAIVEEKVKPARLTDNRKVYRERWWQFAEKRNELYQVTAGMKRVLVRSRVSNINSMAFVPTTVISSEATVIFASQSHAWFALLQAAPHTEWLTRYASSMRTDVRYTPSDCFDTYAFPTSMEGLESIGVVYYEHRRTIMLTRQEGLTKTYNRFHDPEETADDIQKLRELHVEMDKAVVAAYGWDDLALGHGFHDNKQGVRFSISEAARREVLGRLLKLNHERYAEEVKQGLHDKKAKGKKAASKRGRKTASQPDSASLFGEDEEESEPAEEAGDESDCVPTKAVKPSPLREKRQDGDRLVTIDEIDTNEVMAAFRQAARGRGWMEREELLKEVSVVLGYQRLGPKIEEALRGHLRAAIRRKIIEGDGTQVRAGTATMADYGLDELREVFASVMRKGPSYEREDVIQAVARHLGFARLTDTSRDALKSAINSGIRQGVLGYEGSVIWREE